MFMNKANFNTRHVCQILKQGSHGFLELKFKGFCRNYPIHLLNDFHISMENHPTIDYGSTTAKGYGSTTAKGYGSTTAKGMILEGLPLVPLL